MAVLKCPQCARELAPGALVCPWDGALIKPGGLDSRLRPALQPGQRLGDYVVGALLGSGGMGEVYAGEQPMIGKKVAIKVLKAEVAADPGNVQRMLSEARAVNAIRHRSIVDIFNFGTLPGGRPYLVMEYLEGMALEAMLRKQGTLIPADAAEFLEEICSALAAAHGRGIVHRDLKPGNVFIVSEGKTRNRYVKLVDFGLSKSEALAGGPRQTLTGTVVGTPEYIAPEQARGETITARTDLYSLGVMAFEMLTGSLPFAARSMVELMMMHVQAPAPRVSSKIDFCPPALDALVYQLMSKSPDDRPRSAEVVRLEVARIRREMRESQTAVGHSSIAPGPSTHETIQFTVQEKSTPIAALVIPLRPSQETIQISMSERNTPNGSLAITLKPSEQTVRIAKPDKSTPLGGPALALWRPNPGLPRPPPAPSDATARYASVPGGAPFDPNKLRIASGALIGLLAAMAFLFFFPSESVPRPLEPATPVTLVPPPEPVPAPMSVPVVQEGPTNADLEAELAKLLYRSQMWSKTTRGLKQVEDKWTQLIREAKTVEDRKKILDDLKATP